MTDGNDYCMDIRALPPKPDPQTGEPRPPRAPGSADEAEFEGEFRAGKDPSPPPGQGPLLECFYQERGVVLVATALSALVFVAGVSLATGGFGWMSYWWTYAIAAGLLIVLYRSSRGSYLGAGADWLQNSRTWVRTYELTKVRYLSTPGGFRMQLTDSSGRTLGCSMWEMRGNPALWDLVYNGIRHSVALNGAELNWIARRHLPIPDVGSSSRGDW